MTPDYIDGRELVTFFLFLFLSIVLWVVSLTIVTQGIVDSCTPPTPIYVYLVPVNPRVFPGHLFTTNKVFRDKNTLLVSWLCNYHLRLINIIII